MKTKRRKREANLGFSEVTRYLVTQYRILKFLERASHRVNYDFGLSLDKCVDEEYNNKDLKETFVAYVFHAESEEGRKVEFLRSKELAYLGSLYRVSQKRGILEDGIARYIFEVLNPASKIDRKKVNTYAAHLRYYRNHPEIHREYKLK